MNISGEKRRGRKRTVKPFSSEAARIGALIYKTRMAQGWKKVRDLAEKLGISQPMLSKIEAGQVNPNNPKSHGTFRKIESALKLSLGIEWPKGLPTTKTIPIMARVAAGMAIEFLHESEEDKDAIEVDPRMIFKKGNHYALRVDGESMEDAHILTGDIVLVREWKDHKRRPNLSDIIVADIRAEGITLKRWTKEDDEVILLPASKSHEPIRRPEWRVKPVAIVVGVIRMIDH